MAPPDLVLSRFQSKTERSLDHVRACASPNPSPYTAKKAHCSCNSEFSRELQKLQDVQDSTVTLRGWVLRLRALAKTTFVVLKDCSGTLQCVASTEARSLTGFELDVLRLTVLNPSANDLPFHSSSDLSEISPEILIDNRPLALRNESTGDVFKIQAAILEYFRVYLTANNFTEILTSKIVSSGTEGGTNLFEIKYFDRVAYLAQSPQFYKEHCVAGLERVFETGHVYRAEPHATSRHLTEYYSLDLEMGFIDGPEDVIELEKNLLSFIFEKLNERFEKVLKRYRSHPLKSQLLPSLIKAPVWEFSECLERLKQAHGRTDLLSDLDPEGERQLCHLAEAETGIPAVFVLGFPLKERPFYTQPRGTAGAAQSFDLLFQGLEITTSGQRIHSRAGLEASLKGRGLDPKSFESHLRMFELGMPPHGGLAIGLERLTAQILNLKNVRETTLYPRDRYRIAP